ncbi:MAG: hypothetical protein M5U32_21985 [Myxococcota bacterium]|nr:hypothetical protein [Myxococcota bacterium]
MNTNFESPRALSVEELDLVAGGVKPRSPGGCIPTKGTKDPRPSNPRIPGK